MIGVRRRLKGEIYSMVISQHPQKYIPTDIPTLAMHLYTSELMVVVREGESTDTGAVHQGGKVKSKKVT